MLVFGKSFLEYVLYFLKVVMGFDFKILVWVVNLSKLKYLIDLGILDVGGNLDVVLFI